MRGMYTQELESDRCFSVYCQHSHLMGEISEQKIDIVSECFRGQITGAQDWEHIDTFFDYVLTHFGDGLSSTQSMRDTNQASEVVVAALAHRSTELNNLLAESKTTCSLADMFRVLPIANLNKEVRYDSEVWLFKFLVSHCSRLEEAVGAYGDLCAMIDRNQSPISCIVQFSSDIPLTWALALS